METVLTNVILGAFVIFVIVIVFLFFFSAHIGRLLVSVGFIGGTGNFVLFKEALVYSDTWNMWNYWLKNDNYPRVTMRFDGLGSDDYSYFYDDRPCLFSFFEEAVLTHEIKRIVREIEKKTGQTFPVFSDPNSEPEKTDVI